MFQGWKNSAFDPRPGARPLPSRERYTWRRAVFGQGSIPASKHIIYVLLKFRLPGIDHSTASANRRGRGHVARCSERKSSSRWEYTEKPRCSKIYGELF
jgi:hypothetical protein